MISRPRAMLLGVLVPFVLLSTTASADSFKIYVGYADSLRPSGFFPNPFAGGPGVVYSGQLPSSGSLDSSAVRIDNTGMSAITISNLTVTLNSGTGALAFALWSSPVTLAPGQIGIYAQTTQYNFDGSDYGFLGATGIDSSHPLGGCTNPGALTAIQQNYCVIDAPVVAFQENGTSVRAVDTGNILNTFGYDFINGSSDGNESINWNAIGGTPNRGGSSTPEPSTLVLLAGGLLGTFVLRRFGARRAG